MRGAGPPEDGAGAANDLDALHLLQRRHLILLLKAVRKNAVLRMTVDEQQDVVVPVGEQSASPHQFPCGLARHDEARDPGEDVVHVTVTGSFDIASRDHRHRGGRARELFLQP